MNLVPMVVEQTSRFALSLNFRVKGGLRQSTRGLRDAARFATT